MKHENDQDIENAASQARMTTASDIEICFLCEDAPVHKLNLCNDCHEHHKVVSILTKASR